MPTKIFARCKTHFISKGLLPFHLPFGNKNGFGEKIAFTSTVFELSICRLQLK
jgi:hypothetical protein